MLQFDAFDSVKYLTAEAYGNHGRKPVSETGAIKGNIHSGPHTLTLLGSTQMVESIAQGCVFLDYSMIH
jgi:hypothetical protein